MVPSGDCSGERVKNNFAQTNCVSWPFKVGFHCVPTPSVYSVWHEGQCCRICSAVCIPEPQGQPQVWEILMRWKWKKNWQQLVNVHKTVVCSDPFSILVARWEMPFTILYEQANAALGYQVILCREKKGQGVLLGNGLILKKTQSFGLTKKTNNRGDQSEFRKSSKHTERVKHDMMITFFFFTTWQNNVELLLRSDKRTNRKSFYKKTMKNVSINLRTLLWVLLKQCSNQSNSHISTLVYWFPCIFVLQDQFLSGRCTFDHPNNVVSRGFHHILI